MKEKLKIQLMDYLEYLLTQPHTRNNQSLIDCTILIMQEKADTEESLEH